MVEDDGGQESHLRGDLSGTCLFARPIELGEPVGDR